MPGIASALLNVPQLSLGTTPILKVSLGTVPVWPGFTPVTTEFTTAGAFSYTIPSGASGLDIIVLGSGACGKGMGFIDIWGPGGGGGQYSGVTLIRGTHFAAGLTSLSGVVGVGRASNGQGASLAGNPSTVTVTGYGTITGAGGAAGASTGGTSGGGAYNFVWNGVTYVGGAQQNTIGAAGLAPGGGGASHTITFGTGGAGANGKVWIRAF
ncbi:hypothetical protein SEA_YECEY3_33 [Mycobacterium phage Yecey3]|uniref:Glycine-rich domain-containing protein n=1 Tax=Mycobacterium phage Yecey3 TaxID=2656617 RepID=A0A649V9V4_9CAUD|nr:minor tail protein [Mycobacterium phage Yecey3]QGJ88785.1 hypothetical protein SEA_YECEY3_33 [Mycobacterium phage Yecey3]